MPRAFFSIFKTVKSRKQGALFRKSKRPRIAESPDEQEHTAVIIDEESSREAIELRKLYLSSYSSWPGVHQTHNEPNGSVGHRDDQIDKRCTWPSVLPPPIRPEPENPETGRESRRSSLCKNFTELSTIMGEHHDRISVLLDQIHTPATVEAQESWGSIATLCIRLRCELVNLEKLADKSEIHPVSSFWVKSWKVVYEVRGCIQQLKEILGQIDDDYRSRCGGMKDPKSSDRLEGCRLQGFGREVDQVRLRYTSTAKAIFEVNRFAMGEQKRDVRKFEG
ncbi:uncharacterized protein Z518_06073 [Rhinocladiella mackenziei CBS 650.93]|uniref:Uncharacterized protein n=1 Tax=Rhinocladiella mackenziei CBS 650.93 TaxID=1442369 RepID=A0A0D2IPU1_9EURO|nr:uncharacterized protein Z518_06073 [Rhinocladiella mackenziei CBS 650.93]KIX05201.1 hypothetical protein Z518_06073 [Rhinocladiella mackenziei CBS 650.93]